MPMDYAMFQQLLKEAVGTTPQIVFAEKAGISPPHLNRMLNGKTGGSRPALSTLRKIAENSNVPLEELLISCGYKTRTNDDDVPVTERTIEAAQQLYHGMQALASHVYPDLNTFIQDYCLQNGINKPKIYTMAEEEYEAPDDVHTAYAEYCQGFCLSYYASGRQTYLWFMLLFCRTIGGHVIVTDIVSDVDTLCRHSILSDNAVSKMFSQKYACFTKRDYNAEKRLLAAIFGETEPAEKQPGSNPIMPRNTYMDSIFGFGFLLDSDVPTVPMLEFLRNHADNIPSIRTRHAKRLSMVLDYDNDALTDDAVWHSLGFDDWGDLIADIISYETKQNFLFISDDDEEGDADYGAVMLLESEFLEQDEMVETVSKYARELGLDTFGEYVIHHLTSCSMLRYTVETEDETDENN